MAHERLASCPEPGKYLIQRAYRRIWADLASDPTQQQKRWLFKPTLILGLTMFWGDLGKNWGVASHWKYTPCKHPNKLHSTTMRHRHSFFSDPRQLFSPIFCDGFMENSIQRKSWRSLIVPHCLTQFSWGKVFITQVSQFRAPVDMCSCWGIHSSLHPNSSTGQISYSCTPPAVTAFQPWKPEHVYDPWYMQRRGTTAVLLQMTQLMDTTQQINPMGQLGTSNIRIYFYCKHI